MRLWPGITLGILLLAALGRSLPALRIIVYIGLFIVIRDVMTPVGLWRLGPEGGLWIRFTPDSLVLALLGLGSLAMVAAMCLYDPEARSLLIWFKGNRLHGLAAGMFAALVIALPLLIIYRFVPLEARGGPVAVRLLPGILTTTLLETYTRKCFSGVFCKVFLKKSSTGRIGSRRSPPVWLLVSGILFWPWRSPIQDGPSWPLPLGRG